MTTNDGKITPDYDVQVFRPQPGSVTTLNANDVAAIPAGAYPLMPSAPGGAAAPVAPWAPNPSLLMMPQPSVIVVTMEAKKDGGKKDEKKHSEVFTRI